MMTPCGKQNIPNPQQKNAAMATGQLQMGLEQKIAQANQIVATYKWLIDAYIVDFYEQDHWSKLPASWATCLADVPIRSLSQLLSFEPASKELAVWPLAIIALRSLFRMLVHTRINPPECANTAMAETHHGTVYCQRSALFKKSVKLKKRHEIEQFALSCSTETTDNCKTIIDIGSGQGNLARTLAYGFGFQVCCIEQNISYVQMARQKDSELWQKLIKFDPSLEGTVVHPVHLHEKVNLDKIDPVRFVQMLKSVLNVGKKSDGGEFSFGLVGLHPCGDLAPSLLRLFLACQECRFIKLVCCCYMKLSSIDSPLSSSTREYGFPLSDFCHQLHLTLTYEAREIACHAIEQYREKLLSNYCELKVHAYRAALETIIVRLRPDLRHSGLKGGIKASEVSFEEYCHRAIVDLDLVIDEQDLQSELTRQFLDRWEQVVKFYTLRLMFAPLVETIILYDRLLFLLEKGTRARIDVLFDPFLSPRNHAITAFK